jgi:hypothetical protein
MKGPLHAGQLFIGATLLLACNGIHVLGVIVCRFALMRDQVSATWHLLTGVICSDNLHVFMQLIHPPHPTILLLLQVSSCVLPCKQCQVKAHVLLVCQTAAAAAYYACLQLIQSCMLSRGDADMQHCLVCSVSNAWCMMPFWQVKCSR